MNYESELRKNYQSLKKSCIGYVINLGESSDEVEESLQTALLRLYKKINQEGFVVEKTFKEVAFGFFRNVWRERYSTKKRQRSFLVLDGEKNYLKDQMVDESAIRAFELEEEEPIVFRFIKKQKEGCKKILTYYYIDDITDMSELEKLLNLSKGAGKVKKRRCMITLKIDILKHFAEEFSEDCLEILKAYFEGKKSYKKLQVTLNLAESEYENRKNACMIKLSRFL